ncbi:MAG TPA: GGDEF domain-containing protein [Polyangiaceae bacterium]|nr:GGDEF domain-containing protein [Polyangiaceae bacterium]
MTRRRVTSPSRDSASSSADPIDVALAQLHAAVREQLRGEQLTDRLTRLANNEALSEWLEEKVESGEDFWIAFVEIDRFKSVNDEFGYESANEFLRRLATRLSAASRDYFAAGVLAFRAHGDEFYLAGPVTSVSSQEELAAKLEHVRSDIAQIRVAVENVSRPLRCTVSIGWLLSADSRATNDGCTQPAVRRQLEIAVSEAKHQRDTVLRFTPEMHRPSHRDARGDCSDCLAKFTVMIPLGGERSGSLFCPNCGAPIERPRSVAP